MANPDKTPPDVKQMFSHELEAEVEELRAVVERLREALLEACDSLDAWHLQNPEDTARLRAVASPDKPPDRDGS